MTNDEIRTKIGKWKGWEYVPKKDIGQWGWKLNGKFVDYEYEAPNWPESIEDAMSLFNELRMNFFRSAIYTWDHTDKVLIECEYRQGHNDNIMPLTAEGSSIPLAICLAYIAWRESNALP